jgi:acyl-CoA synthetase (AMP-forming)/AMP-acid ligase II
MKSLKAVLANTGMPQEHIGVISCGEGLTVAQLLRATVEIDGQSIDHRAVAICLRSPISFVAVTMALDGRVSKLLLLSPDLSSTDVQTLMNQSDMDILITDREDLVKVGIGWRWKECNATYESLCETVWQMTTSGTTGVPKIAQHTLESLTATLRSAKPGYKPIWGLLYEASRFAGLQVLLQSLLGGGCLIAPDRALAFQDQIAEVVATGCTHLSATPTLWRKILMLPLARSLKLQQITLGGESADTRILDALAKQYGGARIAHIYASTEIGVGFSVTDGKQGFPLHYLDPKESRPHFKVKEGVLWVKSASADQPTITFNGTPDDNGFICTGDCVEIMGNRVFFSGRKDAYVNVGGTKIQLEHVENVIRQHAAVMDCQVSMKPNAMTGALLALQVVAMNANTDPKEFIGEIRKWCRDHLPREAQPGSATMVIELDRNASGKLRRQQ